MIPSYHYLLPSSMPLDLNEDQNHLFCPNHQPSSSSSSLPYPIGFNPDQAAGSYYWEAKPSQIDEEAKKNVPSSGSWDHPAAERGKSKGALKLKLWNKEERKEHDKAEEEEDGSLKWLPSKMRIIRKMMMGSDDKGNSDISANNSMHKFEDQTQPLSSPATDDSSSNTTSHNSNITIRVCADCHTTKTPLWRSGPRGPKSLCNACGIRQRKARRAMAAAAALENGATLATAGTPNSVKGNSKLHKHKKENKPKMGRAPQMKRKRQLHQATAKPISRSKNKFSLEDFAIRLSNNLALQQLVFPQDEKEAAILLMSLSYGLVH
ncbi:hypothetical protein L6164_013964 [Bauhinia variegata]|uniref:Uncharacterized protein n=1 Tax=Bauhinia variegata TaxID=167791 RepID=A0ACB9NHI3_BAUVA|nr:hypothetical protein L6164_013964 [Bauhinia variegata]